jgi:hypothetical protein
MFSKFDVMMTSKAMKKHVTTSYGTPSVEPAILELQTFEPTDS